jgi:hypothetical protein
MLGRLTARFELLRPRTLARTTKSLDDLASEVRELRRADKRRAAEEERRDTLIETLCTRLESLAGELREISETLNGVIARENQLRAIMRADAELADAVASLPKVLDLTRIVGHIRAAVERSELRLDPFPHAVVSDLFPRNFYAALLRGIPPVELFGDKSRNKQHVNVPLTVAPEYSRRVWNFLVYELQRELQPLLVEKFRAPLASWITTHWPALGPDPFGEPMELDVADGRIMLRERGYHITPHRDPKWGFLTCILYLARENDSEAWGTQLYSVDGDVEAAGAAPHWIEQQHCHLVDVVPYRPNTMLVLLNSTGAHGARIPDDAEPADLRRYIYQFRIGASGPSIPRLMAMLPDEQRPLWAGKLSMG